MPTPFLSSEEYDERAHQLYNEGNYDQALDLLREGLGLYPDAVDLHVGIGYARLARDEFAWARRSFEEALRLDPEHEDALAGLGECLLKFGQEAAARRVFGMTRALGYEDDLDLMLQIGRALFREGLVEDAREYFEVALRQAPEHAETVALVGYAQHRLGDDDAAVATLRRALTLDPDHAEARIYLGNILYDRGDHEAALLLLDRTTPDDHWDELGIWRLLELKRSLHRLPDDDPELAPWEARLVALAGDPDPVDELLAEIEQRVADEEQSGAQQQLELFGAMLDELAERRQRAEDPSADGHRVILRDGRAVEGSWEDIVRQMRDAHEAPAARSLQEYMRSEARRNFSLTGVVISTSDAESFVRGSADAGLLRIVS